MSRKSSKDHGNPEQYHGPRTRGIDPFIVHAEPQTGTKTLQLSSEQLEVK